MRLGLSATKWCYVQLNWVWRGCLAWQGVRGLGIIIRPAEMVPVRPDRRRQEEVLKGNEDARDAQGRGLQRNRAEAGIDLQKAAKGK